MGNREKTSGERRVSRQREAGEATRRATRRRLLTAATQEFADRGYVAATVARIADRADVSLQTLYSAWGSKRALLRAVMEAAVAGGQEPDTQLQAGRPPTPFIDLDETTATDPRAFIGRLTHEFRMLAERSAIAWQSYRDAAAVDPDVAADWQQLMEIRRANIATIVDRMPAANLRPGLTKAAAADTVWVIASPDSHDSLVRRAGYSYDAYEDWAFSTICAALLPG